ncbi:MAG: zinc-ribbon and DUF3426 domain-containing protein [Burkholderiales bacterium]|nr:zinc-ribbon and DUF3426 domain-containing protein [Burkholderiales bacterium]
MFTRCTHCDAVFRVTLEQLQASSGQVRCGVCQEVFDAFVSLSAADPRLPATTPALDAADSDDGLPLPDLDALDALPSADGLPTPPAEASPDAPKPKRMAPEPTEPVIDAAAPASVRRRGPSWIGVSAVVLLLLGLVLQGAFFLRTSLAAGLPVTRPWLEAACRSLGCEVPLPRLDDRISIETSNLQALDPARPHRVLFSAVIRNRAAVMQEWPYLQLTLTNSRDQAVVRRVFAPTEYNRASSEPGFAANSEFELRLYLDTSDVEPAGYRIYLFHP